MNALKLVMNIFVSSYFSRIYHVTAAEIYLGSPKTTTLTTATGGTSPTVRLTALLFILLWWVLFSAVCV